MPRSDNADSGCFHRDFRLTKSLLVQFHVDRSLFRVHGNHVAILQKARSARPRTPPARYGRSSALADAPLNRPSVMRHTSQALGKCNGSRPWLGAGTREACGEPNRLLIRSASNAYFPQLMSVISIPDTHTPVDDVVRSLWYYFLSDVDSAEALARTRRKPTVAVKLQGLEDNTVLASIARVRAGGSGLDLAS